MAVQADRELFDVIVVGAGISGLHAAQCLVREGLNVCILEGRPRVGGRAWTLRDPSVGFADLGGAYYGEQQTQVIKLAESLGLDFYEVPQNGKAIFCLNGVRKLFEGDVPPLSLISLLDLSNCLQLLDKLSLQVPLHAPWTAPEAEKWDSITLEEFVRKSCWTEAARLLTSLALFAVTIESKHSMLDALFLIHSCGGVRALLASQAPYGMQSMKIKQGSNSISEKMADDLKGNIRFETRVTKLQQMDSEVEIHTEDGITFRAREVLIAFCPLLLKHISFEPSLPMSYKAFADINQKSRAIKTVMYYKRAHWTDHTLKGEFIAVDGLVYYGISDAKCDGSHPAIIGFVDANKYGSMTVTQRRDAIAKFYAEIFRIPEMADPVNYKEKDWGDEDGVELSGICVYTLPPGFITTHRMLWGKAFGRIKFAGAESSAVFRGYMEGGVRAAHRAVAQVLNSLDVEPKDKQPIEEFQEIPYYAFNIVDRLLPSVTQLISIASIGVVLISAVVYRML
ncbi:hypothetical protein CAPTEDRAFT_227709 [Capitella teleta]|uniref:Amine oxidase n=1 Tax=Capitella teleta TaxID=283909 RepID=R7TP11_CAPTE|nr:hypothetical protein CAPTEDRAFT_227709 [Capitella teleta]|eukprot:ELT95638.1 hypothetical protein CAPTEDRAFT_227709 [Capitella teleta]